MQNLRKKIFRHENCKDLNKHLLKIPETKRIKAYFLAPKLHPLIDLEILKLLNEASPNEVSYQYIQFDKDYSLNIDSFN